MPVLAPEASEKGPAINTGMDISQGTVFNQESIWYIGNILLRNVSSVKELDALVVTEHGSLELESTLPLWLG